jgi:hypothetical protein
LRRRPRLAGEGRAGEEGLIITLVAVFMLFVIGAMMALSIDVVTFYTARSEAQLAADSAALAGARVLANSGLTSTNNSPGPASGEALAKQIAQQVATANTVGGVLLTTPNVAVTFNDTASTFATDPHITVTVTDAALPTFFARLLGRTKVTVAASATAEAYNPSNVNTAAITDSNPPVAPICVKPWLLPNLDPTAATTATAASIFDRRSGAITNPLLVGQEWPSTKLTLNQDGLYSLCGGDCSAGIATPTRGAYYPAAIDPAGVSNAGNLPVPTQALPTCNPGLTKDYQLAVAGCIQEPIACGTNATPTSATLNIDTSLYGTSRDTDTVAAASCLIHFDGAAGDSDSIPAANSSPPFEFYAGAQNPIVINKDVLVSDSIVTIPVVDYPGMAVPPIVGNSGVTVVGFLQVFLNPSAAGTLPYPGAVNAIDIPATIINMAGCGINATGTPIFGNGASPVAVRLISPP